jgi:molybdenum cofactor cytidylyltransferase
MTGPESKTDPEVGAVVLAAGLSSRMGGQAKQLLPWGDTLMIRHIVMTLLEGGAEASQLVVVVGHQKTAVTEALAGLPVQTAFNPDFADGSMLRSLQAGLALLNSQVSGSQAALVALGDQPQIQAQVTRQVIARWRTSAFPIVAPSFGHKRGHPLLFSRSIWSAILSAPPVGSPRDLLNGFSDQIDYLPMSNDQILRDIDTPDEYQQELRRRV